MGPDLAGIIEAKINVPPHRPGTVSRTSILDELAETSCSLVLVQAPAGFGKSTVLEQWAHRGDRLFAWVSLDPSESDSTMFWRHVYAAIRVCVPGFGASLYDEMSTPEPDLLGSVLPGMLNELAASEEGVVIALDDYHRVRSSEVDQTLELFIRRLPVGSTLAITTRSQPDLEVAWLRSRGLVHVVGAERLSLSIEDTASVLRSLNADRTDHEVEWIHDKTEGWPAGVYLFGLLKSLDQSARTTTEIRDYLMAEMLSGMTSEDLAFMRRTSILSHLEAGFCDYVTQADSGQERLERLASSNLLIMPIDQSGDRFRYHHLLQAELGALLRRDEGADAVASTHRRAKEWSEDHGDISEAVHHAVRAGDMREAGALVADHWYEYLLTGRARSAYQWLSNFSEHDLHADPPLAIAGALISAFAGDTQLARELASSAEAASYDKEGIAGTASYESSVALMRATIAAEGPASALADALRAVELEPRNSPFRPLLVAMIGTFKYSTRNDSDAHSFLLEGADAATGPPQTSAYALGNLALFHAWRDDAESAMSYARRAISRIDETKVGGLMVYGLPYAVAARLVAEEGHSAESRRLLRHARRAELTASNAAPFDSMVLRTTMAEAFVSLEEFGEARTYAERALANLAVMTEGGLVAKRLDGVVRMINNAEPELGANVYENGSLLSPREVQVLSLMTTGETLESIGQKLYVSRNTVKTHSAHIYRKLGVSNRDQAVAVAQRLSLL